MILRTGGSCVDAGRPVLDHKVGGANILFTALE